MRGLNCIAIGDSLTQAAHDEADLGGFVGRLVDWGLSQTPPLYLWFQGRGPVKNHIAPAVNVQWHEAFGGLDISQLAGSITNRLDQNKAPTGFPMLGTSANSIYRKIDFVIWAGGANNMNNATETNTVTWALTLSYLRSLRTALNVASPNARIIVLGGCTDWGDATAHTKLVGYNAGIAANVYDVFDAENPSTPLIRMDWYTLVGLYNATDWDDLVHWKSVKYDALMNTATTGMIAVVGPILLAAAQTGSTMALSTFTENTIINHIRNTATYSPAATHYMHLYTTGSVPITPGTAASYAVVSKTNNTTTWPNTVGRVKSNGVQWAFPSPGGTWPNVTEWRITDSATEGAGNILATNTGASPVPVDLTTGPFAADISAITLTAAAGGFVDTEVQGALNLVFGGTAKTQLATIYGSYWNGDPQGAGSQVGSRVAITQASTWAAASGGFAITSAGIALTHQATGTYWAEHDASVAGNLVYSTTRPLAAGSGGTILAGQLKTTVT